MNLLRKSLDADPSARMVAWGQLIFRASAGAMILYIHGWHKLEGWIAYVRHGTAWTLEREVAEMHFPAPLPSAVAATIVQFICPLFFIMGLFTRINALLLTGVLSVALLQNLLANRDPQLAILYILVTITIFFTGGGKFSLDSGLASSSPQSTTSLAGQDHALKSLNATHGKAKE